MNEFDEQVKRISAVLTKNLNVNSRNLKTYLKYLKENIEFPCQLTGAEDFQWEEYYIFGPGSKTEYKELKKTRPSFTDDYELTGFDDFDEMYGILVNVKRISDNLEFTLPLVDLKATNEKSKNYRLLDDYSVWFVNYR